MQVLGNIADEGRHLLTTYFLEAFFTIEERTTGGARSAPTGVFMVKDNLETRYRISNNMDVRNGGQALFTFFL